ncbi:MAG: hypothetical protein Q3990_08650, partial [Desulfovibrionaceae bacterium]|nr:hypothetical protein [Desulfovibrionaceae bacterium]
KKTYTKSNNKIKNTINKIETVIYNKKIVWSTAKYLERNKKNSVSSQEDLKNIIYSIYEKLDADDSVNIPLVSFYSTNRSVVSIPLRVRKQHKFDQIAALKGSLLGK